MLEVQYFTDKVENGRRVYELTPEPTKVLLDQEWITLFDLVCEHEKSIEYTKSSEDIQPAVLSVEYTSVLPIFEQVYSQKADNLRGKVYFDKDVTPRFYGANEKVRQALPKGQHPIQFIWVAGAENISGELVFRDHLKIEGVFVAKGSLDNPVIIDVPVYTEGVERPYYVRANSEIRLFVDGFSGGGVHGEITDTWDISGSNPDDNITADLYADGFLDVYGTGATGAYNNSMNKSPFNGNLNILNCIVGENITSLGNSCFRNCSGLETITLPDSLQSLGDYCFQNCSSLETITLPDSLQRLGNSCFYGCSNLKTIYNYQRTSQTMGSFCFGDAGSTVAGTKYAFGYSSNSTFKSTVSNYTWKEGMVGQQTNALGGRVFDAITGKPVNGAKITLIRTSTPIIFVNTTFSDVMGYYYFADLTLGKTYCAVCESIRDGKTYCAYIAPFLEPISILII